MTSPNLSGLIEQLRAATGPDREIDALIASLLLGKALKREPNGRTWRMGHKKTRTRDAEPWVALPAYTGSADATLDLVDRLIPFGPMTGHEMQGSLARDGQECFTFRIRVYGDDEGEPPIIHWATSYHSYPLAILEALLLALQSEVSNV